MPETNTRDLIGEKATLDGLLDGSLTSFVENSAIVINNETALAYHNGLKKINLQNIRKMKKHIFEECNNLEELYVNIADGEIPDDFAWACRSLKKINIENSSGKRFRINSLFCVDVQTINALILNLSPTDMYIYDKFDLYSNLHAGFAPIYVPDEFVDQFKANAHLNGSSVFPISEYPISASMLPQTITDTWSEIQQSEEDGTYLTKYHINDTKVQIIDGTYTNCRIIGFDKDDLSDGSGKAHITWMTTTAVLPVNDTFQGENKRVSWGESPFRAKLQNVLDDCDSEFKNIVKSVKKTYRFSYYTNNGRTVDNTDIVDDKLTLPSSYELGATGSIPYESTGVKYDVFTDDASRKANFILYNGGVYSTRTAYNPYLPSTIKLADGKFSNGGERIANLIMFCT